MTPAALSLWLARVANGLRLLPVGAARPVVRAYLARDPEAAAKVAGAWVDPHGEDAPGYRRVRMRAGFVYDDRLADHRWLAAEVCDYGERSVATMYGLPGARMLTRPTRAEAEAAVDALLAAAGWVLGEEVTRG